MGVALGLGWGFEVGVKFGDIVMGRGHNTYFFWLQTNGIFHRQSLVKKQVGRLL